MWTSGVVRSCADVLGSLEVCWLTTTIANITHSKKKKGTRKKQLKFLIRSMHSRFQPFHMKKLIDVNSPSLGP